MKVQKTSNQERISWSTRWQRRKSRTDTFFFFKGLFSVVKLRTQKREVHCLVRESEWERRKTLNDILNGLLGRYEISFEMPPQIGKTLSQRETKTRKRLHPIYFCDLWGSLEVCRTAQNTFRVTDGQP